MELPQQPSQPGRRRRSAAASSCAVLVACTLGPLALPTGFFATQQPTKENLGRRPWPKSAPGGALTAWEVLGVAPDADTEEVEAAYQEKSISDQGEKDSIERQIRLLAAYQELLEKARKAHERHQLLLNSSSSIVLSDAPFPTAGDSSQPTVGDASYPSSRHLSSQSAADGPAASSSGGSSAAIVAVSELSREGAPGADGSAEELAIVDQRYLPFGSGPVVYELDSDRGNVYLAGAVALAVVVVWVSLFGL